MKTQLETTAGLTTTDLFQNDSAQGRVEVIRKEALAEVFDVTTHLGRSACISHAAKVTKTKTAVDKLGKALSDALSIDSKKVLAERKIYRDGLDALKLEVRKPVTDWEAAESAKLAKVQQAFAHLEINSEANNITGELYSDAVLQAKLEKLEMLEVADFGDESARAQELIFAGKTKSRAGIQQRKDADELAELRALKVAQVAKDEKAARDKEIADAAVVAHEAAKVKKAESFADTVTASGAGGVQEPDYEKEITPATVTKEPAEFPWLEKKPANPNDAINDSIMAAFCFHGEITKAQARLIIAEIQLGKIDNISINY